MKIQTYVKNNWKKLPISTFNEEEVVIVQEFNNSNEGWGHHSYAGVGIGEDGAVYYCFSSGCSCNGTCGLTHANTAKVLPADFDLSKIDYKTVNFASLQVDFDDY